MKIFFSFFSALLLPVLIFLFSHLAAAAPFPDATGHTYEEAITYVQEKGIVEGYSDGSFKPDSFINRAEFTKILIESILEQTPAEASEVCFPDVLKNIWYEKYVCFARDEKIINGYPNGTFQADKNINISEAGKILVNTFKLAHRDTAPNEEWFVPFFLALETQKAIPGTIQKTSHLLTRGEMAELIMRLKEKDLSRPSLTACDLIVSLCANDVFSGYGDELLPSIDMRKVRQTWLSWYNTSREAAGLHHYKYNNALNRTAYIWSDFSRQRGFMDHKRVGQTTYYDYNLILKWFQNLGLDFVNVYRVTFTENIGWGVYNCSTDDCTQKLTEAIRSTFDFYMSEKDKEYKPHYNSIMNKYFNEVGLGIAIDNGKYFLTVHYGTKLL